ncbi:FAD-dependent oxidoreductase [Leucobacter viscericola]|uniref:L-aspartate oxidase n=1 Tax=Leucobacter viscericola TaxID=2714935 RepID=A0A6G7XDS1_9MICO|nr:FAD-dependent oxidoreductase [Leucobacter viscericola]QIK62760.1 FAD-dependent oxidoreductase [Leucobacter viscericola]
MILVLGSGVAGLSCALEAARSGAHVTLVTPGRVLGDSGSLARELAGGNTALAQGGIAAAIGVGDSVADHVTDTVAAGAGLVDLQATEVLALEGVGAVRALLAEGFDVDREANGAPRLGLEGAHGASRIVHAGGDRTGAILHAFLTAQVLKAVADGQIELVEAHRVVSLLKHDGVVSGAVLEPVDGGEDRGPRMTLTADAVVIATGGYAALYPRTSNHAGARGEGIVLAARAGAVVADLEFVQFHPTVLAGTGSLVSEAVRGAGALLLDGSGKRFMPGVHPGAELAPRDVVSREIHRVLRGRGDSAVWLDATNIEREGGTGTLSRRFPGISAAVADQGFDWAHEPIPVSPAAHYTMGGVLSDLYGRSSLPGLYVVGEAASTGVHGANRLASNSLLEGLVFGARAGREASRAGLGSWELSGEGARSLVSASQLALIGVPSDGEGTPGRLSLECESPEHPCTNRDSCLETALTNGLGIERDAEGLAEAGKLIGLHRGPDAELAAMIHTAASARTESRGAHQRRDFPGSDPEQASRRAFRFVQSSSLHTTGVPELRSFSSC